MDQVVNGIVLVELVFGSIGSISRLIKPTNVYLDKLAFVNLLSADGAGTLVLEVFNQLFVASFMNHVLWMATQANDGLALLEFKRADGADLSL